jgi:hypothetical protein
MNPNRRNPVTADAGPGQASAVTYLNGSAAAVQLEPRSLKRTVKLASLFLRLTISSSSSSNSGRSSTSASISFRTDTFTNGEADLPTTQQSAEALQFIGFNAARGATQTRLAKGFHA